MTKIIVDHRERASGIIKELEKKKLDIKIEQLVSADFVLETKDKDGKITTVGVEKKTQNDFINSIIDRRLITQLINLKEHFSTPLLIKKIFTSWAAFNEVLPNLNAFQTISGSFVLITRPIFIFSTP